ncbi:glycosyltransferase [Aquibacillus saliphilus]|uniref:glycosyltransferase n=1 Tax=Aquibacillus saliphilus TaxID=1909422 RepID=UPI001CF02609|nr:glycosyltransferase [Aquibacillus saliphilus]
MKQILVASFDMEVGGVERSLISMLNNFDYDNYAIDLMLYSHTGDFMELLPNQPSLLSELQPYKTFRMSIGQILKSGNLPIGLARLLAKYKAGLHPSSENGYKQMQYMWKYSIPFLPKIKKRYDVAISYLWPHYFIAEKVKANTKIAWIHTDFSTVETDVDLDLNMWNNYHHIVAVSDECKKAFTRKYPSLEEKVSVIENISSPAIVQTLANEQIENPMVNDNRFKIITVARLSHAKGIDQAVRAMKLLKDSGYQDIAWYVVGYGGDEQMIKELINKYQLEDSFILLDKKANPYPYMKEADIYVQPSRYEGKAVTVVEAQILAKPVLITNYPTAKSQVNDGYDGCICELSPEGIANGIKMLYNNEALRRILSDYCNNKNYDNNEELKKLYQLV